MRWNTKTRDIPKTEPSRNPVNARQERMTVVVGIVFLYITWCTNGG